MLTMNTLKMKLKVVFTAGVKTHTKCFRINVTKGIRQPYTKNYKMLMKKSKKAYKWEILMHKIYQNLIRIFTKHKATDSFSETLIKISMQFLIIFNNSEVCMEPQHNHAYLR